jgi:hypothetical protein
MNRRYAPPRAQNHHGGQHKQGLAPKRLKKRIQSVYVGKTCEHGRTHIWLEFTGVGGFTATAGIADPHDCPQGFRFG